MSRIGKKPIVLPEGVNVKVEGGHVAVTGPKGSLELDVHHKILVEVRENELLVDVKNKDDNEEKALWGLFRSLMSNMVIGVTRGFTKKLEVNGIGYKAEMKGNVLVLHVGYSHPVEYPVPEGIEISVEKNAVTISGINKQLVGQTAAEIRRVRKPEPYKGKGIKYADEIIRRKVGKAAAKSE